MCSIVGILSENINAPKKIFKALELLEHRGPDGAGIWCENGFTKAKKLEKLNDGLSGMVALGHTRLSIVGGDTGMQPFCDANKTMGLVHNGEIYNYKSLRKNLRNQNQLVSSSDSEVIIRLIEENRQNGLFEATQQAIQKLDGMYVFAVADGNQVIVARDPIGIKQIYYAENGAEKAFASEKKALWALGFDHIHRLEPGHILEIKSDNIKQHPAYKLPKVAVSITNKVEAKAKYQNAILQSVKKRVDGLNHVGLVLSGGVDSALIGVIAHQLGVNLTCYSIGYHDSNDVNMSKRLAQGLGAECKTIELTDSDIEKALPKIIRSIECRGLVQVEAALFLHFAAQMARQDGLKVMLTGQGADELFGGYPWYMDVVKEKGLQALHQYMWNDIDHLHLDTLEREDKMTMAHSIELRVPFLDIEVIKSAMSIDISLKVYSKNDMSRKRIHRHVAQKLGVPDYIAWRPKEVAQKGSGVHEALEKLALDAGFTPKIVEQIAYQPFAQDYGSNYRYIEGYGEPHVWLYLDKIAYDADLIPPEEKGRVKQYLRRIHG
ncbi:MAG: asparagine synthase (glutamine-hydrolyzing) [bacterium]|nr:MAG: asparagine synthase (glutamine-hydrolyzing) [bacterium]